MRLRISIAAAAALLLVPVVAATPHAGAELPRRLADGDFWRLVDGLSETGGFFRSDNLVSNEDTYQSVLPELAATVKRGGVYFGVGPDQNFTYIATVDPAMAFIVDIRRGNLQLHLAYKALFELSPDRATFLSLLFSRPRPAGLDERATADRLFAAFATVPPNPALYESTRAAVVNRLRSTRRFQLSASDAGGIASVLESFFTGGPEISYSNTISGRGQYPTFRDLQIGADDAGVQRSYLASEANYRKVRSLQQRNLVIPVVGDFAGAKSIRAAGDWVRSGGGTVTAFYVSNVEQYLFQDGTWNRFAANVATLPIDPSSVFIRSCFNNNCATGPDSRSTVLLDPVVGLLKEAGAGRITSYSDVLAFRPPPGR